MADENDDVIVDLDALEETPAPDTTEKPKTEKKTVITPEDGLAKLRKQLDDSEAAKSRAEADKVRAEQERDEAAAAELAAKSDSQDNRLHLVNQAIKNINTETDALERNLAEAYAGGDFAAAAKIQRDMTVNASKLDRLDMAKSSLEKAPKPVLREKPRSTDPVERLAAQMETENSPRSAAFVRENPDYVTDPEKNQTMMDGHYSALSKRLKADSPAYIDHIKAHIAAASNDTGIPEGDDSALSAASTASTERGRQASPASAPVTRSGNGAGGRPTEVRLTADEVEMARNSGMSNKEWAEQKLKIKREKEGLH